jgi:hypothetical protein
MAMDIEQNSIIVSLDQLPLELRAVSFDALRTNVGAGCGVNRTIMRHQDHLVCLICREFFRPTPGFLQGCSVLNIGLPGVRIVNLLPISCALWLEQGRLATSHTGDQ